MSHLNVTLKAVLEWVGPGAPPSQEHGEADSLENAGKSADGDGVKWALLGHDLCDKLSEVQLALRSGLDIGF